MNLGRTLVSIGDVPRQIPELNVCCVSYFRIESFWVARQQAAAQPSRFENAHAVGSKVRFAAWQRLTIMGVPR